MKPVHKLSGLLWVTVLVMLISPASSEFSIEWFTLDSGGGESTVGTYALHGTIGQWDTGTVEIGPYTLCGGFWCGIERLPCPHDLTGDDQVNIDDIFVLLGLWGTCPDPCPPYCTGDLTKDCSVNIDDIFAILGEWGLCP